MVLGYLDAAIPPVLETGLSGTFRLTVRTDMPVLCSPIGDLRVTQTVDANKRVHMLLAKSYL